MYYIYRITNLINGKVYLGQTNNPYQRKAQYKSAAKCGLHNQIITRAIAKYRFHNFNFEIIAMCRNLEDANIIEMEVIKRYDSRNLAIGYNIEEGGGNQPRVPETCKKISESLQKYYATHDGWAKGTKLSEEHKKHLSEIKIGTVGTNTGKKFSKDHKLKIGKSNLNKDHLSARRFSEETELEICRLYVEEKIGSHRLGKRFKCYSSLIGAILRRHNITRRYAPSAKNCAKKIKIDYEIKQNIYIMYHNGEATMSELAKQFCCGKTTINSIIHGYYSNITKIKEANTDNCMLAANERENDSLISMCDDGENKENK